MLKQIAPRVVIKAMFICLVVRGHCYKQGEKPTLITHLIRVWKQDITPVLYALFTIPVLEGFTLGSFQVFMHLKKITSKKILKIYLRFHKEPVSELSINKMKIW